MSGWGEQLAAYVINHTDETGVKKGLCTGAALYGQDGTAWAATDNFSLSTARKVKTVNDQLEEVESTVNEFNNLKTCLDTKGKSSGTGGVFINGVKYQVLDGVAQDDYYLQFLKCNGGGAVALKNNKGAICLATWQANVKYTWTHDGKSDAKPQNTPDLAQAVENFQTRVLSML